jgi:hypothetical protein
MEYIWVPRNSKLDLPCTCLEMQYTASLTHITLLTLGVTLSPFFQHIKHVEKTREVSFPLSRTILPVIVEIWFVAPRIDL